MLVISWHLRQITKYLCWADTGQHLKTKAIWIMMFLEFIIYACVYHYINILAACVPLKCQTTSNKFQSMVLISKSIKTFNYMLRLISFILWWDFPSSLWGRPMLTILSFRACQQTDLGSKGEPVLPPILKHIVILCKWLNSRHLCLVYFLGKCCSDKSIRYAETVWPSQEDSLSLLQQKYAGFRPASLRNLPITLIH